LQSQPQLAAARLTAIGREGLLPFKYIVADCLYGNRPAFLDAVDAWVGSTALVVIPSETRCWLQRPRLEEKCYRDKGEARAKCVVVDAASAPSMVVTVPDRTVWLVIKRTVGPEPSYAYAISKAPVSTPLRTFVWLSGRCRAIEQGFEEGKPERGMDHYEVRKYTGWHHHRLTTMLAHFLLWHLKRRLGKKSPRTEGCAVADVVGGRTTAAVSDGGDRAGVGRVGPATQSQSLSCA
jgi:SRSO17 transposase